MTKPEDIYLLILLFNGNLVLPHRIQQLGVWLATYNRRNITVYTITLITTVVTITLNDAWLSGFTDAEGCFNVFIQKSRLYGVVIRFLLDQKCQQTLMTVQTLFSFGTVTLRNNTNGVYRYVASGIVNVSVVRAYFEKFPLRTKKQYSFEKWSQIHSMVLDNKHRSPEGYETIIAIKENINV